MTLLLDESNVKRERMRQGNSHHDGEVKDGKHPWRHIQGCFLLGGLLCFVPGVIVTFVWKAITTLTSS